VDATSSSDDLTQVQTYRDMVLKYEGLNDEIQALIMAHDGGTENMSSEDVERYRILARQRDEALNEMRWLEHQLLEDDNIQ